MHRVTPRESHLALKVVALIALLAFSMPCSFAAVDKAESEFREAAQQWSSQQNVAAELERIKKECSIPAAKAFKKRQFDDSAKLGEAAVDALQKLDSNKFLQEKLYWEIVENIRRSLELQDFERMKSLYEQMYKLCPDYPFYSRADTVLRIGILKRLAEKKPLVYDLSSLDPAPANKTRVYLDWRFVKTVRTADIEEALTKPEILVTPYARTLRENLVSRLRAQGRKDEALRVQEQLKDKHCPMCHSDEHVVRITYGLPLGGASEDHINGGCVIDTPRFYCKTDKLRF